MKISNKTKIALSVLTTSACVAVVLALQPGDFKAKITQERFSEQAFALGETCGTIPTNDDYLSVCGYSHGLLASGAFGGNTYPVTTTGARGGFVCMEVTVPFQLENINDTISQAVLDTCKSAEAKMSEVYLSTTMTHQLAPHQVELVVVPVIDTSYYDGNAKYIQSEAIVGTAYKCKRG